MRATPFTPWALLTLWALGGCSEVGPTNPFDPATPAAQQAPGAISGSLTLPEGYAASALEAARVTLRALQADATPRTTDLASDGAFAFDDVPAGPYRLEAALDGFVPVVLIVDVPIGGTTRLGALPLEPASAEATASGVRGVARLQGAPDGGHGDIAIEAVGTPYTARTTSDGTFALDLPPAAYTLRAGHPGYGAQMFDVQVEAGAFTALPDPVVLVGEPGRVVGTVRLADGIAAERLGDVVVTLSDALGAAEPRVQAPAGDGRFDFDGLAPGDYSVEVALPGTFPRAATAQVGPGDTVNVGVLRLAADVGSGTTVIEGVARLDCGADACDHGVIQVEAVGWPFVTRAASGGDFRLVVAPGTYTLRVSAPGYRDATVGPVDVDEGDTRVLDETDAVLLDFLPGALEAVVLRRLPDGTLAPAPDATLAAATEGGAPRTASPDADGRVALTGLRPGLYRVQVTLDRHAAALTSVDVGPGDRRDLGPIALAPPLGSLRGAIAGARGVVTTVVVRGAADDALTAPVRVSVPAADAAWQVDGLPHGRYQVTAVAAAHRPPPWADVTLDAATAPLALQLAPRAHRLRLAALEGATARVDFDADDDLDHGRLWLGDEPAGPFVPLADLDRGVALPGDGRHVVRARLATGPAPGDGLFDATSPVLELPVVLDREPPALAALGGPALTRARALDLEVLCADALDGQEALRVEIDVDGSPAHAGPWRARITVTLPDADGPHTLTLRCLDTAGLVTEAAPYAVLLDRAPPVFARPPVLDDGAAFTRATSVQARLALEDTHSGVAEVALALEAIDCQRAAYAPYTGDARVELPAADGAYSVFVCARDAAGNVAARAQTPAITLDTVAPGAPRVTLPDAVTERVLPARFEGDGPDLTLVLAGDLEPAGPHAAPWPAEITLSAGDDGPRVVRAWLRDAAGNTSPEVSRVVALDTQAPAGLTVQVADGQSTVNTRTVAITVRPRFGPDDRPAADLMRLWEAPAGEVCEAFTCADGGLRPFEPDTTLTLTPTLGTKRVCWLFCDHAGNGAPVGAATVALGTHVPRPRPTLTALDRRTVPAFAPAQIEATGADIAADTVLRVGEFTAPCVSDAAGCAADGGAGCADRCVATLPEALLRNAGDYPVRLETPAPVEGGVGASAGLLFLSVVSPPPVLTAVRPRGRHSEDHDGPPAALTLEIEGHGWMDNAVFRLGSATGEVTAFEATPLVGVPPDAPGATRAHVRFETNALRPTLDDLTLTVANPPPGGGEAATRVGWLPFDVELTTDDGATVDLRPSRAPLPGGVGLRTTPLPGAPGGLAVVGADAVTVTGADGGGALTLPVAANGGVVPWSLLDAKHLLPAAGGGRGGRAGLRDVVARGADAFGPPTVLPGPRGAAPVDLEVALLNDDPWPDLVHAFYVGATVEVYLSDGSGGYTHHTYAFEQTVAQVEVVDVDGDGHLDLAVAGGEGIAVRLGAGDGTFPTLPRHPEFAPPAVGRTGDIPFFQFLSADLDDDGRADFLFAPASVGTLTVVGPLGGDALVVKDTVDFAHLGVLQRSLDAGDVDGDGDLDVVSAGFALVTLVNDGRGRLTRRGPARPPRDEGLTTGAVVRLADVDGDGALDAVVAGLLVPVLSPDCAVDADCAGGQVCDTTGQCAPCAAGVPPSWRCADTCPTAGDGVCDEHGGDCAQGTDCADCGATREVACPVAPAAHGTFLRVYRGDGRGAFVAGPPISVPDVPDPSALALYDINGDGRLDAVVGSLTGVPPAPVRVLLGDGAGGFVADDAFAIDGPEPNGADHLAVTDLDLDGRPDLAVGHAPMGVALRYGASPAIHAHAPLDLRPGERLVGLPALGGAPAAGALSIVDGQWWAHRATADGGFAAPLAIGPAVLDFGTVGDLASDGWPDLVAHDDGLNLVVFPQTAAGFQAPYELIPFGLNPGIAVRPEWTGDANAELAICYAQPSYIVFYARQPDGTFAPTHGLLEAFAPGDDECSFRALDLDGDGRTDLITDRHADDQIRVAYGQPDGSFDLRVIARPYVDSCNELVEFEFNDAVRTVGDVDGDGDLDLVFASAELTWLARADGRDFTVEPLGGPPTLRVTEFGGEDCVAGLAGDRGNPAVQPALGDFDGDGRADLLSIDADGALTVRAPATAPRLRRLSLPDGFEAVHVEDRDGDGALDVMAWSKDPGRLLRWQRGDPGATRLTLRAPAAVDVAAGATADVDLAVLPHGVERVGVAVRVEGDAAGLDAVRVTVIAPDGTAIDLGAGPAGEPVWALHVAGGALDALRGPQPEGAWRVEVRNDGAGPVRVPRAEVHLTSRLLLGGPD